MVKLAQANFMAYNEMYSSHGVNDFVICCGYKGYLIKEYFANYFLVNPMLPLT